MENDKKNEGDIDEIGWLDSLALVIGFVCLLCIMSVSYVVRDAYDAYWKIRARLCK